MEALKALLRQRDGELQQLRDTVSTLEQAIQSRGSNLDEIYCLKWVSSGRSSTVVHQLEKLDLTSPAGKMMLAMLAAVAETERDLLVERTQSGLARAKAEGKHLGRPVRTTFRRRQQRRSGSSVRVFRN